MQHAHTCLLLWNQRRADIGCVLVLDAVEIEGISGVAAALVLRTRLGFTGFGFHSIPRPMVSLPRYAFLALFQLQNCISKKMGVPIRNERINESSRGESSKLNESSRRGELIK